MSQRRTVREPRRRRRWSAWTVGTALAAVVAALPGCGSGTQSTLNPAGTGARQVEGLWWLLFGIAVAVCLVVTGLLLWALARRRGDRVQPRAGGRRLVVVAGVALPAAVLTAVYGVGLAQMKALQQPAGPAAITVDVIGHTWWWEVRYPDSGVVTANEIHVPAGQVVHVRLQTADVLHSFWVPQLMPKTDLIAGRINETWLRAERPGSYRGQCAEYCGLQHGHMAFWVVAQSESDFRRWLAEQAEPAPGVAASISDPVVARGQAVLENGSCASCHSVRGTSANGVAGPDLTHLADRSTLAAGSLPNTAGHLSGWIADSQTTKPGNLMPPQPLSPADLAAVVAFLEEENRR